MPLKVQGPVGRYSAAYVEPFLSKLPVVPSMDAAWLLNKSSNEIVVDGKGTSEETIPKYEKKSSDHGHGIHLPCSRGSSGQEVNQVTRRGEPSKPQSTKMIPFSPSSGP
ncbi:hypothetical protein PAXINDRAFT_171831 [Paxillus involutus ATCC 200175]|uniref:Uncharacterized protein n=1 Tax=Paxillus involutus ATCC 200175 TaxID=664439 RepID=A0A0C9TVC7_PAXIN|nr:hypothetical protein PAXINDRAFT_171831 [Paxillus involutus ATCC 200175]